MWFHLHEIPRLGKSTEQKISGCQELGKDGEWLLNGYNISFGGDKNVLELDRKDSCTTLWMNALNPSKLYTLKQLMVTLMFGEFYLNF